MNDEQVVAAYRVTPSLRQVAKVVGISHEQVRTILNRSGVDTNKGIAKRRAEGRKSLADFKRTRAAIKTIFNNHAARLISVQWIDRTLVLDIDASSRLKETYLNIHERDDRIHERDDRHTKRVGRSLIVYLRRKYGTGLFPYRNKAPRVKTSPATISSMSRESAQIFDAVTVRLIET